MGRLRVATYNVHKCRGMDGRTRPDRIVEVLNQIDADVIGLQEVLSIPGDDRHADQSTFLAEELSMNLALGKIRKLRGGAYGNIVLSRLPVRMSRNHDVSVPGREERGCLRADIDLENAGVLHLFNVHLGTSFFERRQQGQRLLEEELLRSRDMAGPRIVLGDFNEWVSGLVSRLLRSEFSSADLRLHSMWGRSYPGFFPFMQLDHIYYDDDLVLESVHLHRTLTALVASDHLPIVAEFVY
ncbi:MAG: endonuclease/exonuclease/phosphatase family protein [Acidobacteria bacterium]|nr:endonuclease/exonuclease/phosphatase family protein [Acidobacteriota bacterium]MBI3279599.1 endonuclease/exonuclease/phosphatase family protein [Acidobacteriota bacterium]